MDRFRIFQVIGDGGWQVFEIDHITRTKIAIMSSGAVAMVEEQAFYIKYPPLKDVIFSYQKSAQAKADELNKCRP